MFKSMLKDGVFHGYSFETDKHFLFFGSKHTSRASLPQLFPTYEFCFLTQLHGDHVVPADPVKILAADAHFTARTRWALVVQTADCLPILLAAPTGVAAVHAGWRGVAKNILAAVHAHLPEFRAESAWIGPHIRRASFAVDQDVADQLRRAAPTRVEGLTENSPVAGKVLLDLTALVRAQLVAAYGLTWQVQICRDDTMISPNFHSYRRDGERAGRQYSFVVIKG